MIICFISRHEVEISKFSSILLSSHKKGKEEKKAITESWSNSGWKGPLNVVWFSSCSEHSSMLLVEII